MGPAFGWGALAASSLVLGALLGVVRVWPRQMIGLVLAFGARSRSIAGDAHRHDDP
jgi:ZIP family zinc transporter